MGYEYNTASMKIYSNINDMGELLEDFIEPFSSVESPLELYGHAV